MNWGDLIVHDPAFKALNSHLSSSKTPAAANGLWGSSAPILATLIAAQRNAPVLYVCAHAEQADHALDDMEAAGGRGIELFPAWETLPNEGSGAGEIGVERARLCDLLRHGTISILIAPIQALMQPVPAPGNLDANTLTLVKGEQRDPESIAQWLVERGFVRLDQVEQPGDFALRGGILDIFISADADPVRLDFFGDEIESIRQFESATQRSIRELPMTRITRSPALSTSMHEETTSLWSYFSNECLVVINEPLEVAEIAKTVFDRLGSPIGHYPFEAILRGLQPLRQLQLSRFPTAGVPDGDTARIACEPLPQFESKSTDAVRQLLLLAEEMPTVVYCDNRGEEQRLRELIEQVTADANVDPSTALRMETAIGLVHEGFIWHGEGEYGKRVAVVPHHQLFRRYSQVRRIRKATAGRAIESFLDLNEGDYVVHIVHGIAKFVGMKTMRKADSKKSEEFLTLRFAEDSTIHVPVTQIDLVQKYIGARGMRPTLSKLGGTRWQSTKAKVEESLNDLASDLLRIQAERQSQPGVSYPDDTHWQREFEDSFLYAETPDQLTALSEIKQDQRRSRPMDRLLCGDVGFGKTELAMRAAFKVVEYGRQVAVLVPTTVLADQHHRTFCERFADYPFRVECLNRFRSPKEQRNIIESARKGQVDVLIGTHRILSKDVQFADLGLAIVDEEQRFGVEHKERLKRLRTTVDVLTLSATPIPRTLHMSMVGLRDISSLATPPMDRRSIATRVTHWNDEMIREAIARELNRDGQVYFVHNRVQSIQAVAARIATLAPDARIIVGHGQMDGDELEAVMMKFIRHEADILVSTTIIEAGLDIPNANTMFIDRADMFGLADLHQLRGRVGRYKHRAYCYLLLSPNRPLTDTAARRLKAIEEFSDLGAGFRIAMRDLEIRGAGNILGPEQSGNIAAVGYELYCQLLEKQVRQMRGEPPNERVAVHLELDLEAYIPRGYVASDRQRMDCYRRFSACRTPEDVDQLERDLRDAYGPYPQTVSTLIALAEIRVRASEAGIESIIKREPDLIFRLSGEVRRLDPYFTGAAGRVSFPDGKTLHWRLPEHYFHGETLIAVLRNLLRRQQTETASTAIDPKAGPNTTHPRKPARSATHSDREGPIPSNVTSLPNATPDPVAAARRGAGPVRATPNAYPSDAPIHKKRRKRRE
ncbi:MAG: transcription-repair coupling factor [Phycisphaerae bacterium]|nr:transcription-repair coupling factor [Phycisphaerae bacterium]